MKKKIYLLLMATLTMGMQTYAESYGIKVGGVDVTSDNCTAIEKAIPSDRIRANISGDDYWITYDNSTKTLTFYNVDIRRSGKDNRAILNDGCVGLKIVLRGENFFYATDSSPVRLNKNTTITSESVSLDKRMPFTEIVGDKEDALTVGNGAYVTMEHAYLKIYAHTSDALDGINSPTLSIKDSWIEATGEEGHYAMCDYNNLTVQNSYVMLNTEIGTKAVQNLSSFTVTGPVEATENFNPSSKTFVNSASSPVAKVEIETQTLISSTAFPDANFQTYLRTKWNPGADGKASYRECMKTDMLNVSNFEISSLKGIEHFANLMILLCYNNKLTSLSEVDDLPFIIHLYCDNNFLTVLDMGKKPYLTELSFNNNKLTAASLNSFPTLTKLSCNNNELIWLDVTNNTNLVDLSVHHNQLKSLDVTKNTKLVELSVGYNQLTSLDLSKNTELTRVYCYENQLTSLDVTKNTNLEELAVGSNNLTALDVTKNTKLKTLECACNQLTSLNLSKNTELTSVYCYENQLASLDLTNSTKLTLLNGYENKLTSLDLSKCTELEILWAHRNKLTSLLLPASVPNLNEVVCYKNLIKTEQMQNIVNRLPTRTAAKPGILKPIAPDDAAEGNVITTQQVQTAQAKYWNVTDNYNQPYEGSLNTAIVAVEADQPDANSPRYNLGGQRIGNSYRGIVIQNGRKKVVK